MTADVAVLATRVRQRRSALDVQAGEARALAKRGQEAEAEVARLEAELESYERVCGVLTKVGETEQATAQRQVEELVTRALQVIFGEELSFRLVSSVKRDQAFLDFVLVSSYGDKTVETPVMEARGGGMAAVVGFALRLVVLLLTPGARRFLALDESFAHVSALYEPRVAEFLREVADKAGVQLLLITHSSAYSDLADTRYRLALGPDGVTRVFEGESE